LPHMVVLTIKVWRTRTPFLIRHLWILDCLESQRSVTGSDTNWRTGLATREVGVNGSW
jgi:hypothetical protein